MKQFAIVFSLLIFVSAFDENTLEDVKEKGTEIIKQLPDNVKEIIPKDFDLNKFSVEQGEEQLKTMCLKHGTNESFDNAMAAKEDIEFCFKRLVNFTQINKEIENAKPSGDLDIVFRRYCKKSPDLRNCVTNFTTALEPCLSPEERDFKFTITNITDALINFICFKEGDRIALFIAEKGPECINSKEEDIKLCLNTTLAKYYSNEVSENTSLLFLKLGEAQCGDVNKVQKCIVGHLEKCSDPTPANIVDSMFTFVKKVTPCQQYAQQTSGAASLGSTKNIALAISALVLLVIKLQ